MRNKRLALLLSLVMGVAFISFGILGCGSDKKRVPLVYVVPDESEVPVGTIGILGLLAGKCFAFDSAAFLDAALAAESVTVCYDPSLDEDNKLGVTMDVAGDTAEGLEYLINPLFLEITDSDIPGVDVGVYAVLQELTIVPDGSGGGDAEKTFRIETGIAGESDSTPLCESLACDAGGLLNCDGVRVGVCEVTGAFGG